MKSDRNCLILFFFLNKRNIFRFWIIIVKNVYAVEKIHTKKHVSIRTTLVYKTYKNCFKIK